MRRLGRGLRELGIVLRSVWWNLALFGGVLLAAALLMQACGCYPGASFNERLVTAFYMARLESVGHLLVSILTFAMPLLSLFILGEGALRIAGIYLGRRQHRGEWEKLMAGTLSGHIVLCGAGEFGRALLEELFRRDPQVEEVIIDNRLGVLEELGRHGPNLHHIHGDMTSQETLTAANVAAASTVLLTSGDDAHNLEAAFKALRLNPSAEMWIRLYRIGLSEMMDTASRPNVHFFSPYQRVAEALADGLLAAPR